MSCLGSYGRALHNSPHLLKCVDFFGKVKDRAGDMEKILKDKDKHGMLGNLFLFFFM